MNNNETRTLWISLAAGVFASFLVYSYSQEKQQEYDKKYGAMKRVVVASRDIAEMETIDDTMLDIRAVPEDYIGPASASDLDTVVGQVAAAPLKKGEQILTTKLLTPGPDTGIALQVSPGKRAVTVPVDEVRGIAKLVRPGDRIDLVAALDVGKGAAARREVTYLMQDVPVLATGINVVNNIPRTLELDPSGKNIIQNNLSGDTKYTTVTLEVDPKQAQDLVYLTSTQPGNLFMVLRNPNDRAQVRYPSSSVDSIAGSQGVQAAAAPTANFSNMDTTIKFQNGKPVPAQ
ncbi:MAG: Flp pilus assembly protein CpaB [Pseudomonadota bacterium]|jgi:pilus assembly protein CpaB